jgi:hypothetical protein
MRGSWRDPGVDGERFLFSSEPHVCFNTSHYRALHRECCTTRQGHMSVEGLGGISISVGIMELEFLGVEKGV